jgi:hypothetical protein
LRWSTGIALGLGILSLAVMGLGLAGELNRPYSIALVAVAAAAGGIGLVHGKATALEQTSFERIGLWLAQPAGWGWIWVAVMPALAIAVLGATMPPGILWGDEPHWYDVLEYHLQVPREWYEAGRMMPLHHNVFSYFPFNVEMLYWLAMELRGGPWAGMYAAQFLHLGLMVVFVMAIAGAAGKSTAGALVAATPWLALLAPVAYNEGGLLLYGGLAMIWGLRAINPHFPLEKPSFLPLSLRERTGVRGCSMSKPFHDQTDPHPNPLPEGEGTREDEGGFVRKMALAGAMAGLACGVKLTAVPMVLLALALGIGAVQLVRRPRRPIKSILAGYLVYFLVGGAVFSPWLIRNLAWTGNPIFPEAMQLLGRAHFTPVQVERWGRAHDATANQRTIGARMKAGWTQIAVDWRYGGLIWIAAITSTFFCRRNRSMWVLIITGGCILLVWLFFTHLQSRFFVLVIPLAGLAAGLCRGKLANGMVAGAAIIAAVIGWIGLQTKLDPYLQRGVQNAIGLEDYRPLMPSQQVVDLLDGSDDLALIGDAAAFRYQIPMTRLYYRTVFDVPADGDAVHAWLSGRSLHPSRPTWLLIDPPELERFARTYWQIPPVPDWVRQRGEPFVINARSLP